MCVLMQGQPVRMKVDAGAVYSVMDEARYFSGLPPEGFNVAEGILRLPVIRRW